MAKHISNKIHGEGVDIFAGLQLAQENLQGWASTDGSFKELIEKIKPKTIIEVGTWFGASAVNMAKLALEQGISKQELEIVCVDTFLGSVEHYTMLSTFNANNKQHGRPLIYDQFLSNIIHQNLTEVITPFPIDSGNGALALNDWKVQADLVYIDAAHDFEYVQVDFIRYANILRPGGYILIDDWHHQPIKEAAKNIFGDKVFEIHGKAAWIK